MRSRTRGVVQNVTIVLIGCVIGTLRGSKIAKNLRDIIYGWSLELRPLLLVRVRPGEQHADLARGPPPVRGERRPAAGSLVYYVVEDHHICNDGMLNKRGTDWKGFHVGLAFHIYHRGLSLVATAAAGLNEGVIGRRGRRLGRLAGDGAVGRAGRAAAHARRLDAHLAARGAGVGRPDNDD